MAKNYDFMLQVLKKWPVDKSKGTRCYGLHLRELARKGFPTGNIFPGDEVENQSMLKSLLRLADNKYAVKYPYRKEYGASGYRIEEIKKLLSDEYVSKYMTRKEE